MRGSHWLQAGGSGLPLISTVLCVLLFIVEVEIIEITLRNYYDMSSLRSSVWAPIVGKQLYFFNFVVAFPAILLLLLWPRLRDHAAQFRSLSIGHSRMRPLALQLVAYAAFATLTYLLSVAPESFGAYLYSLAFPAWAFCLLATGLLALLVLAPPAFWMAFIKREKGSLAFAVAGALGANFLAESLPHIAPVLAEGALHGAGWLLGMFYDPVVFDVGQRIVGTQDFSVTVSNDCAGYEGIALISIFATAYLWLFKADFRFPQALLVVPLGICVIWAFNVVRIAVLIAIGDAISPALALAGFHSNAGWIAFIAVSLLLLALLHRVPFLSRQSETGTGDAIVGTRDQVRTADALLLPFITLLGSALLLGALTTDFDWGYPLKVLATGAVLGYFWRVYRFGDYTFDIVAPLIGVAVFILWMLLVQPSNEVNLRFEAQIATLPSALAFAWLVFRVVGSVITVPLAEELAFRGYLLSRLSGCSPSVSELLPFKLFAVLASSALFGLMHTDWLAGTLAGLAYAGARLRRGQTGDAVIAHMTTNGLLCGYVLWSGQWSYW